MKTLAERLEEEYPDEEFLVADGFDEACIGMDCISRRLIYSVDKCVKILMEQGMSYEEAIEYFDFNVGAAYVGEMTPIWCEPLFY